MSFLDKVPENITELGKENQKLGWSKREFYGHECDCEFCDAEGEGRNDAELDKIDKVIQNNELMIRRLKNYQKLWIAPTSEGK